MTGYLNHTDTELFALIAQGDEKAFEEIFLHYTAVLFPNLKKLVKSEVDAQEIIQEVFLKLWLQRNKLPTIENPRGWLQTLASNTAIDFMRTRISYETKLCRFSELQPGREQERDDIFWKQWDAKETKAIIQDAVRALPMRRRQIFQMYRLEGYSRKEIAQELGVSENFVRNNLGYAAEFIEAYLANKKALIAPISVLLLLLY